MSLVISDLSKSRHGTSLLNGVNLELRSGAIHGLFGRNGAGKSTLLNIIANRLVADAGSVSFDGNRMTDGGGMWERLMLMDETWPYPVEWRLRSVFRLISRRYGGFDDVLAGRMMQAFGLRPDARFMRLSTVSVARRSWLPRFARRPISCCLMKRLMVLTLRPVTCVTAS